MYFLSFLFITVLWVWFSYNLHENSPSKCQVPKPIKLLEGIGNGGNGTLIWSIVILWTNYQHFIFLRSVGVYRKPSPVKHLWIFILCPCRRAPLYRPMLILACLTGVSGLEVYLCQWVHSQSVMSKKCTTRVEILGISWCYVTSETYTRGFAVQNFSNPIFTPTCFIWMKPWSSEELSEFLWQYFWKLLCACKTC